MARGTLMCVKVCLHEAQRMDSMCVGGARWHSCLVGLGIVVALGFEALGVRRSSSLLLVFLVPTFTHLCWRRRAMQVTSTKLGRRTYRAEVYQQRCLGALRP